MRGDLLTAKQHQTQDWDYRRFDGLIKTVKYGSEDVANNLLILPLRSCQKTPNVWGVRMTGVGWFQSYRYASL